MTNNNILIFLCILIILVVIAYYAYSATNVSSIPLSPIRPPLRPIYPSDKRFVVPQFESIYYITSRDGKYLSITDQNKIVLLSSDTKTKWLYSKSPNEPDTINLINAEDGIFVLVYSSENIYQNTQVGSPLDLPPGSVGDIKITGLDPYNGYLVQGELNNFIKYSESNSVSLPVSEATNLDRLRFTLV